MDPSAAQPGTQRALAAIVLTDAVGFSARMSEDEEGTLALIQRDLKLMANLSEGYGGQVLKSTGDGLLMSFSSAVQAVRCGQDIQKQLASLSEGQSLQEYLQHRIGIHLGDVLFSHGDVLGNGVNIAARLQTQSIPGGICISRTVYDVVKARLQLQATFLGPLKLKNIKEPVPAFQIPPIGQAAAIPVTQPALSTETSTQALLADATQNLQADAQSHRIKKLIFGACQGVWENDRTTLSKFELLPLLEKLCQRYRTLASLEEALKVMVSRLNRKIEYQAVADTILQALHPVYAQNGLSVEDHEDETSLAKGQPTHQAIAASLSKEQDQLRIKKLLYAVIHTAWENDPTVLAQHPMDILVAEVHQLAATETDLQHHLERIIKRLNQRSRYTQIALIIAEAFQPFYGTSPGVSLPSRPEKTTTTEVGGVEQTGIINGEFTSIKENQTAATQFDNKGYLAQEQTVPPSEPVGSEIDNQQFQARSRDRANLFNLRLEIMRYTNPLRAKILLLSTVRSPFTFTQQDWITLKSKTLDDLVQDVFEYCSSYADLESKLIIMSHCVDNTEENTQTVGAILQAMRPFYPTTQPVSCLS